MTKHNPERTEKIFMVYAQKIHTADFVEDSIELYRSVGDADDRVRRLQKHSPMFVWRFRTIDFHY
jgi:hypothetical protein